MGDSKNVSDDNFLDRLVNWDNSEHYLTISTVAGYSVATIKSGVGKTFSVTKDPDGEYIGSYKDDKTI